jgi:hypothetical protein
MSEAYSTHGKDEKCVVLVGKLDWKRPFEDLGVE